jgi:hypothetical protein
MLAHLRQPFAHPFKARTRHPHHRDGLFIPGAIDHGVEALADHLQGLPGVRVPLLTSACSNTDYRMRAAVAMPPEMSSMARSDLDAAPLCWGRWLGAFRQLACAITWARHYWPHSIERGAA